MAVGGAGAVDAGMLPCLPVMRLVTSTLLEKCALCEQLTEVGNMT